MRKMRTVIASFAALSLVLAACGGDDDDNADDTGVTEETGGTETASAWLAQWTPAQATAAPTWNWATPPVSTTVPAQA